MYEHELYVRLVSSYLWQLDKRTFSRRSDVTGSTLPNRCTAWTIVEPLPMPRT